MEDLGRIPEDVSGENLYYESDLTEQMREKIRLQAGRLRQLEQYRVLCEQRIQELCPSQQFPIKPEDLGHGPNLHVELQMAKKKIARLESSIHNSENLESKDEDLEAALKFERILKDKSEVEESLRAEMLVCEEQRTYIEVLRQALEEKNESPVMVKLDFYRGGRRSEEAECESRIQRLKEEKNEELQSLLTEKKQLEHHLSQAGEALQAADEEISQLEEEKQNLLNYVDDHSAKEQEMEKELNDLSHYFQQLKNELDSTKAELLKTKAKLDQENKLKDSSHTKNELLTEDLYKTEQLLKDLQITVNDLKTANNEKDLLVKRLKEDKLAMEIRIENLQANSTTLTETLKEMQVELEECEREVKEAKKGELMKVEGLGKLRAEVHGLGLKNLGLTEELEELKKVLEGLKREKEKSEKAKESDQKLISELKSTLGKLKGKCEGLEESVKRQEELERLCLLSDDKLQQVQEEYLYLQEEYNEIQQRELIQTEALNDLRRHNSELSREVEELYRENQKITVDFSQKSQSLQETLIKLEKTTKFCEKLENDNKTLEIQLKSEKNQSKQLKDQTSSSLSKVESLQATLHSLQDSLQRSQKTSKAQQDEITSLKLKIKTKERETEEEKHKILKLTEELQNLQEKTQINEKDFEKLQTEVINCYKLIAGFAGKHTILNSDSKHSLSNGYKEFLFLWKDKISTNCSILGPWVQNTIDEIENMSKQIFDLQKCIGQSSNDLFKLTSKLEDVHSEDFCNKQEQNRLKTQILNWANKFEKLEKTSNKALNDLKLELASSQQDLGYLLVENNSLKAHISKIINENHDLKTNSELFKSTLKSSEEKINSLKNEKNQLEGLVKQVQRTFGSNEISKIHNEISRIRPELEGLERERLGFECQLLKYEVDPRNKETSNFKELNSKLLSCERQINNYKRNLAMLQEDVNKEQMVQNLRLSERETLKKGSTPLPKSVSMSSRHLESSKAFRKKSPFD